MVEHVVIISHDPHMGKGKHIQPGWLSKARGATYKMWQSFKETTVSSLASPLPISVPKSVIQYYVIFLKKALEIICFMRSPTPVPHQAKDGEALLGQRHGDPFHHGLEGWEEEAIPGIWKQSTSAEVVPDRDLGQAGPHPTQSLTRRGRGGKKIAWHHSSASLWSPVSAF